MVPLSPVFARNKELLQALIELLDQERLALGRLNPADIQELAAQKKVLLEELDSLNLKRHDILVKFGIITSKGPEEGLFRNWLDQQQTGYSELKILVKECEQLLETCKTKNLANEQILSIAHKRNQNLLEILQGQSKKHKVYTAKGGTRPVSSKHTIGRA